MNEKIFFMKIKADPIYIGIFENTSDIESEYDLAEGSLSNIFVLLAYYDYIDYSGESFVLFEKDNKLFEVNGGHCSCHGLEGQWDPEETSISELRHRLKNGTLGIDYDGRNEYAAELSELFDVFDTAIGN